MSASHPRSIDQLLEIMAQLRHPEKGCSWDVEQSFATIAPYTIEEAYEVADAIERNDLPALTDELGDLLFQVVFHAQMADFVFKMVQVTLACVNRLLQEIIVNYLTIHILVKLIYYYKNISYLSLLNKFFK